MRLCDFTGGPYDGVQVWLPDGVVIVEMPAAQVDRHELLAGLGRLARTVASVDVDADVSIVPLMSAGPARIVYVRDGPQGFARRT